MSTAHHFRSAFVPHDLPEPRAGTAQGPLAGLTAAVKDMYDIAELRTGGGNPDWLADHRPALADDLAGHPARTRAHPRVLEGLGVV